MADRGRPLNVTTILQRAWQNQDLKEHDVQNIKALIEGLQLSSLTRFDRLIRFVGGV
jgi:hypothetical protein